MSLLIILLKIIYYQTSVYYFQNIVFLTQEIRYFSNESNLERETW